MPCPRRSVRSLASSFRSSACLGAADYRRGHAWSLPDAVAGGRLRLSGLCSRRRGKDSPLPPVGRGPLPSVLRAGVVERHGGAAVAQTFYPALKELVEDTHREE